MKKLLFMLLMLVAMQTQAQQFGAELNIINNLPYVGVNAGYETEHISTALSLSTNYVKAYVGYRKDVGYGFEGTAGFSYRHLWFIDVVDVGAGQMKVPRRYNTFIGSTGVGYNYKHFKFNFQGGIEAIFNSRPSAFYELSIKYIIND